MAPIPQTTSRGCAEFPLSTACGRTAVIALDGVAVAFEDAVPPRCPDVIAIGGVTVALEDGVWGTG